MRSVPHLRHTNLRQLARGSLGFFANSSVRHFVLGMTADGDPQATVCLFPLELNESPRLLKLTPRDSLPVLDYGSDWVLDFEIVSSTWPGNLEAYDRSGVLYLADSGPILSVRSTDQHGFKDIGYVNLQTSEIVERPQDAWPTEAWTIWASAEDKSDRRGQPLYRHRQAGLETSPS